MENTGDFTQLYKIQEQTLEDISRAICEKRGLPYHKIAEVALPQQIYGLKNLCKTVPDSLLSENIVLIKEFNSFMDYYPEINNEQIALCDSYGLIPYLISADTSVKPVFAYYGSVNGNSLSGYYVGNYIT